MITDEFLTFCDRVSALGWHEYNGGNVSKLLTADEYAAFRSLYGEASVVECDRRESKALPYALPELKNQIVLVTSSGSHLKNISSALCRDSGLIRVDERGMSYQVIDGCFEGRRPTSELVGHLLIHASRLRQGFEAGIVYHAHTPSLIALSHVIYPLNAVQLTRELWSTFTECPLFCPRGVGVVDFLVPGSLELAEASVHAFEQHDIVLWAQHGVIVYEKTFDDVRGLVETVEKAARIALDVRSATASNEAGCQSVYAPIRHASMLSQDQLRLMNKQLGLHLNEEILEGSWD